jgi:putative nucleotidyltransferase-like protein
VELSPERKLLLACGRSKLTPEDHRRIADLAGVHLDWDQLVSVSYAHGIAPLIYHSLIKSDVIGQVPATAAQTLRSSYYTNAARNSLLYDDLKRLLLALRQEKINAIVLKGAALAETVYAHRALRPMSDIDLLVRKEQLSKVESKLLDMGYLFDGHGKTKEFYLEHRYHWVFVKRSDISIDIDGFWERAQWTKIAAVEALVLSPEDLVLYLCQHFWKHNLAAGIRALCDIAETTKCYGDGIDWTKIANISSEWGMNAASHLVLSLARELLDASIPKIF